MSEENAPWDGSDLVPGNALPSRKAQCSISYRGSPGTDVLYCWTHERGARLCLLPDVEADLSRLREENAELKRELAEARWALRVPNPKGAA